MLTAGFGSWTCSESEWHLISSRFPAFFLLQIGTFHRVGHACSAAMQQSEPAALDMWGAEWLAGGQYKLQPDARRYEQYERCFAAVVTHCAISLLSLSPCTSS